MICIKEIAYTCYPVIDVARAKSFYQDLLRLTPGAAFEHDGKHWIEYDIGPGTLAISNMSGDKWKPSANGPSAALEVEDFDAALDALRAGQAVFLVEPMDTGFCRMAIVQDPDGNALTIHQRAAQNKGAAS